MRVSVRGWARDHGERILLDEELSSLRVSQGVQFYPNDEAVLEAIGDDDGRVTSISVSTRIRASMSGEYQLRLEFGLRDILYLAWAAFRQKTLKAFVKGIARFETTAQPAHR